MTQMRKFNSFMDEYRFMVRQNYYPLLKKRFQEHPMHSSLKAAILRAKDSNTGILGDLFNWSGTPEGDSYWRTIYRKHYVNYNY